MAYLYVRCGCINIQHSGNEPAKCLKLATVYCTKCNEKLCRGCADKHHVHIDTFKRLEYNKDG